MFSNRDILKEFLEYERKANNDTLNIPEQTIQCKNIFDNILKNSDLYILHGFIEHYNIKELFIDNPDPGIDIVHTVYRNFVELKEQLEDHTLDQMLGNYHAPTMQAIDDILVNLLKLEGFHKAIKRRVPFGFN